MASASVRAPVIPEALQQRLQVAAIDFGTTFSGYAISFRTDFDKDPLKIITNNWKIPSTQAVSLKAPSCVLFDPGQKFHSFGFEAEDKYAWLAEQEKHHDWFYFKRFKMLLYEHKQLTRDVTLSDDKCKTMSAMKVFSEGIKFLKNHLLKTCEEKDARLNPEEVHWILTVPAIWNDSAKQFMREAAIEAGIETKHLSLALEPEAASLFCRYLPVQRVQGADGVGRISNFNPGKRYLVLDAGGGTVDITVHETLGDGSVKEIYKANGGPWGGTKIDETFLRFLADILGQDTLEIFMKDFKDDYLDLLREFEIKKKTFGCDVPDQGMKITFKIPTSLHETYQNIHEQDLRQNLVMNTNFNDKVTFAGDKLRVQLDQIEGFFKETCTTIVDHLKDIFSKPEVANTETILMVGGFSESKMLQTYIRNNFPGKRIVIPEDAGLAVLKGAVIFGHNPRAIVARVVKYTYGVGTCKRFIPGFHPKSKKIVYKGKVRCKDCFSIHVTEGQEVLVDQEFEEQSYYPLTEDQKAMDFKIFTSVNRNPTYTDETGCSRLGNLLVDISDIELFSQRKVAVKMIYGDTELGVVARVVKTGVTLNAKLNFLG